MLLKLFSGLSSDLVLEILCKLSDKGIKLLLIDKRMQRLLVTFKGYAFKKIINSYNMLSTDPSNLPFLIENYGNELKAAVKSEHLDHLKFYIKNGEDVNNMLIACTQNSDNIDAVKLLLESGADPRYLNDAPLKWASRNESWVIVSFLVDYIIARGYTDNTGLKAVIENNDFAIVAFLIRINGVLFQ